MRSWGQGLLLLLAVTLAGAGGAGLVLWVFGTGPVRGFAVVLTLGIATSMFTALMGSRALVTLIYGGRRKLAQLWI